MSNIETKSNCTIIAGPCAAESKEQIQATREGALNNNIEIVRASLWKPRTQPGFEGVGKDGIPWLLQLANAGLIPATEVMLPKDAEAVIDAIVGKHSETRLLIWLGARNQNHRTAKELGKLIQGESRVQLMIKNPIAKDERSWLGMVDHIRSGGAAQEQLLLCHRGFNPTSSHFRNQPDLELAMRVKAKADLPMIIDPSHICGRRDTLFPFVHEVIMHRSLINGEIMGVDGLMMEVHPSPSKALTDKEQQLDWATFGKLLTCIKDWQEEAENKQPPMLVIQSATRRLNHIDQQMQELFESRAELIGQIAHLSQEIGLEGNGI